MGCGSSSQPTDHLPEVKEAKPGAYDHPVKRKRRESKSQDAMPPSWTHKSLTAIVTCAVDLSATVPSLLETTPDKERFLTPAGRFAAQQGLEEAIMPVNATLDHLKTVEHTEEKKRLTAQLVGKGDSIAAAARFLAEALPELIAASDGEAAKKEAEEKLQKMSWMLNKIASSRQQSSAEA